VVSLFLKIIPIKKDYNFCRKKRKTESGNRRDYSRIGLMAASTSGTHDLQIANNTSGGFAELACYWRRISCCSKRGNQAYVVETNGAVSSFLGAINLCRTS
jgi:hypothetical protein